jgi:hypothetical protein
MDQLLVLATDPSAWLALVTLVVMEVVLGVDNLVFIALLSSRLPSQQGAKARRIGIGLSLVFRLLLVAGAAYVVRLTTPLFAIIGQSFSWRDLILIGGGLFLVFKATTEVHHTIDRAETASAARSKAATFAATVAQLFLLDLVFSIDSIITARLQHILFYAYAATVSPCLRGPACFHTQARPRSRNAGDDLVFHPARPVSAAYVNRLSPIELGLDEEIGPDKCQNNNCKLPEKRHDSENDSADQRGPPVPPFDPGKFHTEGVGQGCDTRQDGHCSSTPRIVGPSA